MWLKLEGKVLKEGVSFGNSVKVWEIWKKEMRRNTRVFGARVLRSGRRLWNRPAEEARQDWIELFDKTSDDVQGRCKENGWHDDNTGLSQETADAMEIDVNREPEMGKSRESGLLDCGVKGDRRWGTVYLRKRKRRDSDNLDIELSKSVDRRYGKTFVRKQSKKKSRVELKPEARELKSEYGGQNASGELCNSWGMASFVASSCGSRPLFSSFLNLVLRYMRCGRVRLAQLSVFLLSEPIVHVYASNGIQFLQDSSCSRSSGFCMVMGSNDSIPFFAIDFNAIPTSFMSLHLGLLLRSALHPHLLMMNEMYMESGNNKHLPEEEHPSCDISEMDQPLINFVPIEEQPSYITCAIDQPLTKITLEEEQSSCVSFEEDQPSSKVSAIPIVKSAKRTVLAPKLGTRTMQLRSGVMTRGIQKRRTSMRSMRQRNPSGVGIRKPNGSLVNKKGLSLIQIKPNAEKLSSLKRVSQTNLKEINSSSVALSEDIESASCSADILVIESDKCYRECGAIITLEYFDSEQWFLVVKRNGTRKFMLQAQKFMRPCCVNRITRAIIWTDDNNWKLEFPNRQDWVVFKELYKKCSERIVRTPPPSPPIPVPVAREVAGYADRETVPFSLPESYVCVKVDEVSRALEKKVPIYDMDSDDEEWLKSVNNESCAENETGKRISEDTFEMIIDTFERGVFSASDDYMKVEVVVDQCHELAPREVLEAVHSYWMFKRKKRSGSLVRMFEIYERRRPEVLPKAIFRKKRSFKRQPPSQMGRGKQLTFLKAVANEQKAVEAQNASMKVEEANEAARRSEVVAIQKRQRAQLLMETSNLATYKATMALQIAEAAAWAAKSLDDSDISQFFLNE